VRRLCVRVCHQVCWKNVMVETHLKTLLFLGFWLRSLFIPSKIYYGTLCYMAEIFCLKVLSRR
jgi:hypothetical protein